MVGAASRDCYDPADWLSPELALHGLSHLSRAWHVQLLGQASSQMASEELLASQLAQLPGNIFTAVLGAVA
jgi:hypothetical protein